MAKFSRFSSCKDLQKVTHIHSKHVERLRAKGNVLGRQKRTGNVCRGNCPGGRSEEVFNWNVLRTYVDSGRVCCSYIVYVYRQFNNSLMDSSACLNVIYKRLALL